MTDQTPPMVCYNHPQRETMLRCNRCERPICNECAVLTPTGYRCKECIRGQQKSFDTARTVDYVLAVIIAVPLAFAGSLATGIVGFFTIFVAPIVGMIIAEAVRRVTGKRRSRLLFQVTTGAALLGSLPLFGMNLLTSLLVLAGGGGISGLYSLVLQGVYAFLVASSVYYRLSGIQIRR